MDKFALSDCLKLLRKDLEEVAQQGKDSAIKFVIDDVSLDFEMVVDTAGEGKVEAKWYLLSGSAKASASSAVTQKMSLKLKIRDAVTGGEHPVSGTESS